MRVPSLPIVIDEFPALCGSRCRRGPNPAGGAELFFLTHFHTDHMKGLSSSWAAGVIITSALTRQLLLGKFEGLRGRVVGLPFWCRTPVLSAAGAAHSPQSSSIRAEVSMVHVTLLPAFHIPGSAMIYLETPSGVTYLHTGDFKYTEAAAQTSPLRTFFLSHRVDHLYLDDTWLHLGHAELTSWPVRRGSALNSHHGADVAGSGIRVLSKLLDADQVLEAIEAIGRRMDHQRQLYAQGAQQQPRGIRGAAEALARSSAPVEESNGRLPFVVRVYLHNQFGKEIIIQQLAMRLRTRALIDDARYARLLTVVEALEEERDDLEAFKEASPTRLDDTVPPLSAEELAWRASGGEAAHYPYNLNCFVSFSQAQHQQRMQLQRQLQGRQQRLESWDGDGGQRSRPSSAGHSAKGTYEPPLIEVVSSRASISPAALQEASAAHGGTPYYGVVISGWARLQSQTRGPAASGQVWHVPTTLHSTPQEIVDFVALLRPLSATPLHYRPSRGEVVMQRLGPYLRTPFVNNHDTCGDGTVAAVAGSSAVARTGGAVRWRPCLPTHLLSQVGGIDGQGNVRLSSVPGVLNTRDTATAGVDGLDSLEETPRRGFRIGAAGQPPTAASATPYFLATAPLPAASLSVESGARVLDAVKSPTDTFIGASVPVNNLCLATLLPSWRLRRLTQSYLQMRPACGKRERVDGGADAVSSVVRGAERHPATEAKPRPNEEVRGDGSRSNGCITMSPTNGAVIDALSLSDIADDLLA
ncbi:hypothetical protein LSCM1_05963 [Leishmania martiniquensis]|uniref:DNA repair metallo-beta-lactamase domain-containing protein n=1 Tax=Leishmania martiniquensis TaxID=1580590 RepID=A0A836HX24_9TRYP|nr:hypothetical protein LSCM1_05963 [Leishmania martiniquensis]